MLASARRETVREQERCATDRREDVADLERRVLEVN